MPGSFPQAQSRAQAHNAQAGEPVAVPVLLQAQTQGPPMLPPSAPTLGHHISGSPTFGMGVAMDGVGMRMGIGTGPLSPGDFPPLRMVKPLPKRRRVVGLHSHGHAIQHHHGAPPAPVPDMPLPPLPTHPSTFSIDTRVRGTEGGGFGDEDGHGGEGHDRGRSVDEEDLYGGMSASAMESIAGELMAHADSYAGQMALQNYYESVLSAAASASGASADMFRAAGLIPGSPIGQAGPGEAEASATDLEQEFDFTPYGRDGYIATPAYGQAAHGLTNYGTTTAYYPGLDVAGSTGAEKRHGAAPVPVRRVTSTIYRKEPTHVDRDQGAGGEDYLDHLQQPKNTKKRKVPANASSAAQGREAAPALVGVGVDVDDPTLLDPSATAHLGYGSGSIATGGREDREGENGLALLSSAAYGVSTGMGVPGARGLRRQPRVSAATLDGLQHKELVRQRKRQLSAVLDALSLGDTFALDQALSSHIPFAPAFSTGNSNPDSKVHLSKRTGPRVSRTTRVLSDHHQDAEVEVEDEGRGAVPPSGNFTFECSSATSERLASTKEEVASLRARFEDELARQSAQAAADAEKQQEASMPQTPTTTKGTKSKKTDRDARIAPPQPAQGQMQTQAPEQTSSEVPSLASPDIDAAVALQQPKTKKTSKKKRRNALAIASNPHHRKNYVPSRLPSQGGPASAAQAAQNSANALAPLPMRFLSAKLAPSRRSRKNGRGTDSVVDGSDAGGDTAMQPAAKDRKAAAAGGPQIVNAADEWICPFCEYALFFSDRSGPEYRRAVRGRKQILRRRRRAQERAAGGLSGSKGAAAAGGANANVNANSNGDANANAVAPEQPEDDDVDGEEEEEGYGEYGVEEEEEAPDIGRGGAHRKGVRAGAG
ncbi:hypothetical protein CONPUDRAFT_91364 [Coniophora puteana RWD-64-598 SS2]|uniref:Uncharacterized protein n=1 Tax=Coniophora puteana (strain RWD-64-598) TaxID=741705 RepID=A0A5M3MKG1_CONPW|nr:uncharacterized protein CONPUDRAFT_91364 [Coniophora puteana RWD-64-598 SS2]EIW79031.1 hypothetical protein CONPUDRAFT_91364 [Coniophora puteana RWD-64-598 SS2]